MTDLLYQFEYPRRLRAAFIGAGGHSFRNIYPSLQYAPVDLTAVCDIDKDRADKYARLFGAAHAYRDHTTMLQTEQPDVVFIVTGYDPDGQVQATSLAVDCLRAGAHVWMEKPTATSLDQVEQLKDVSRSAGRQVMTGIKKIFTPAVQKARAVIDSPEFGALTSLSVRYPQALPPVENRTDAVRMRGFLDHIYHPGAVLGYLGGPVTRLSYEWEPRTGSSVSSMLFDSGAVGSLHLAAGAPANAPLERVEAVGEGASIVIDNGVKITYYRPGAAPSYGREPSFVVPDDVAPLSWEPEFSLGQLYNKNLFYLGYVPEILHFCRAAFGEAELSLGTLDQVELIMRLFEAYQRLPAGTPGIPPSAPVTGRRDETTRSATT